MLEYEAAPFLLAVADALVSAGRDVTHDADVNTVDVASPTAGKVLGVVRPAAYGVTFYVVHPRTVTAENLSDVGELVLRATNDLFDAAFEIDFATGVVAARADVSLGLLGEFELPAKVLGPLLIVAVEAAESAASTYAAAFDAVMDGQATPADAAATVRMSDVLALNDEVAAMQAAVQAQQPRP